MGKMLVEGMRGSKHRQPSPRPRRAACRRRMMEEVATSPVRYSLVSWCFQSELTAGCLSHHMAHVAPPHAIRTPLAGGRPRPLTFPHTSEQRHLSSDRTVGKGRSDIWNSRTPLTGFCACTPPSAAPLASIVPSELTRLLAQSDHSRSGHCDTVRCQ